MKQLAAFCSSLLLTMGIVSAQDIHYSQFYNVGSLRNPALTGIMNEDYRASAIYRTQWASVGEPFVTGAGSAEARFAVGKSANDYVSVGLSGYYDVAGSMGLKTVGFYPSLAFNKLISSSRNTYLSAGFTGGRIQRSYDRSKLTFDNEFQNGVYTPNVGPDEELPEVKLGYWDIGTGLSLNGGLGEENSTKYFIGLACYHFSQPVVSFQGSTQQLTLSTRMNGSLGINTPFSSRCNMQIHASYTLQEPYSELIVGGLLRYSRKAEWEGDHPPAFSAGLLYRLGDAIIPVVNIEYRTLSLGISYDVNVSSLRTVSSQHGGLEVTVAFGGMFPERAQRARGMNCPKF